MNRLKIISPLLLFLVAAPGAVQGGDVKSELVRVETDDGITLDGVLWSPSSGKARVGIALATGTGGEFYSNGWFGERYAQAGYRVLSLNRRDHGQNFGYYKLEPSALDHRYAVDLLMERGVEHVVLVGQSYGTVTVPYYVMVTNDPRVKGMILTAALGDLRAGTRIAVGGQEKYDEIVAKARQMVKANRGQETFLMPPLTPEGRPIMHNYETFLDKRGPDSKAVPYQILSKVKNRPILAIRDPADPLPATLPPAQQQLEESNSSLEYVLLPDIRNGKMDRAAHGFEGRREEVFGIILNWLNKHSLTP
jgi:pimeloyl-ACP methyl ester carboxylesterase